MDRHAADYDRHLEDQMDNHCPACGADDWGLTEDGASLCLQCGHVDEEASG